MDRIIEEVSGTYTSRSTHPHNGYYAGDFSSVAFKQPDLQTLLALTRVEISSREEPEPGIEPGRSALVGHGW